MLLAGAGFKAGLMEWVMPLGYFVRARVRTVGRIARKLVLLSCIWIACAVSAPASEPYRGIQYHATLTNGQIIGSAFMIADGLVVTNAHVVSGRKLGDRLLLSSQKRNSHWAQIVGISPRMDLAVLRVSADFLPVAPYKNARQVRGTSVYAVGVAANSAHPGLRYVVSGQISSGETVIEPFGSGVIARMPGIKRGFSGGPVFDQRGNAVGMIAALRDARNYQPRDAFILSIKEVRAEVGRLLAW